MRDIRTFGLRLGGLLAVTVLAIALLGCPPPDSETTPQDSGVSQHVLDSLRADSLQKCGMHKNYAYQYARSDLRADAIRQFEKALIYCRDDAEVADIERYYARYLSEWDQRDSAFVHYRHSAELAPGNYRTHFWLYEYYYDSGAYQRAIEQLVLAARSHEEEAKQVKWLKSAANMMESEGMQDEACEVYTELRSLAPGDPEIAERMLSCIGDDPVERLNALRDACMADTTNRSTCRLYAREAENADRYQEALDVYLMFTRQNPDDIDAWESVQEAAHSLNDRQVILEALRNLARLEPDEAERTAKLIDEYFAQDRLQEGFDILRSALRDHPTNAHLLYLAGLYYSRRGSSDDNTRRALDYLCRAIQTNDPAWRSQAMHMYDGLNPRLTEEEINQARFFGRKIEKLHFCDIPERSEERDVTEVR